MKRWNIDTGTIVKKEIQTKIALLSRYQDLRDALVVDDITKIKQYNADVLEREELAWKQRAK